MVRIGIVEDIPKLALALKNKIELSEQFQVKFIAKHGKEAIETIRKNHHVELIFMDINMPIMDGIEATEQIATHHPDISIIMATVYDDEEHIFKAILAGAQGYVLKDASPAEIHQYINECMAGGAPMSPEIASKSLRLIRTGKAQEARKDYGLTAREEELLEQLSKGLTYEQIASNLFISKGTVRKHVENIYRKLQVTNRVEALNKVK